MALYLRWAELKSGKAVSHPMPAAVNKVQTENAGAQNKENEMPPDQDETKAIEKAIAQFQDKTQTIEIKSDNMIKFLIENEVKKHFKLYMKNQF